MAPTPSKPGAEVLKCAELSADQISTMQTVASPRDAALLALLAVTNWNLQVVTTLTWEDIEGCSEELPEGRTRIRVLRRFTLPPTVCKLLKEWREVCPTTERGWVFPGIRGQSLSIKSAEKTIFEMAEKAGIKVMSTSCFGDHLPMPKDAAWILAIVSGNLEEFFYS
jgi:integrase